MGRDARAPPGRASVFFGRALALPFGSTTPRCRTDRTPVTVRETSATPDPNGFIARWAPSGGQESANYQLFLTELCDLLDLPHPEPAIEETRENAYVFERRVAFDNGDGSRSSGWIDLYKRGCFVLEAKQSAKPQRQRLVARQGSRAGGTARRGGRGWDDAMRNAFGQARSYVHVLPPEEGSPPFLLVVDVAHVIDLYADFSGTGKAYSPFPDAQSNRIHLDDLRDPETQDTLRAIWQRPYDLDPTRESARVTKEVARRLADLARGLEKAGHGAEPTADFLMRCLFTLFAEDVELLPKDSVTNLLKGLRGEPHKFKPMIEDLWRAMNRGGFTAAIQEEVRQFNGTLFEQAHALPLDADQLELMIQAAEANWRDVEPAIFGSLFEGALDRRQRHELGAHFTPRAYVERLVMPTVIEPLREQWTDAQTASATQRERGDQKQAVEEIRAFHRRLCATRVLDPACGSGNFLYVTMEHMKRLEAEVLEALYELDPPQYRMEMEGHAVQPEQFLGIEINPRAAAIARLVIWIGYLQWHLRTRSGAPGEPILRHAAQIEYRDAVLSYKFAEIARDEHGQPIRRHAVNRAIRSDLSPPHTPEPYVEVSKYHEATPAYWPKAEFIVGNPPFIGNKRMRAALGDGYVDALRKAWPSVPESADFVMYWWYKSAKLLQKGELSSFGLVTTSSITQTFNRKIVEQFITDQKRPLSLTFACANHPWVDDGADVRIAMTSLRRGATHGLIAEPIESRRGVETYETESGKINADLKIGADITGTAELVSNSGLSHQGVILIGEGFRVYNDTVKNFEGTNSHKLLKRYMNGKELMQNKQYRFVIDTLNLSEDKLRLSYPEAFQHLYDHVKPERDQNRDRKFREKWWLYGRPRYDLRKIMDMSERYIATCRTSKHRVFVFLQSDVIPDAKIIFIGLEDAYFLGVLSSYIHTHWSMSTGGWLGVGND